MKAIIFDNGGKTFDRYTIILSDGEIFSASDNPFHPQGVGTNCGNIAYNYYLTTVGAGYLSKIEKEDKKHYNKLIRQAVKEQIAIAKNDPEWLDIEMQQNKLPTDVQMYINQLLSNTK